MNRPELSRIIHEEVAKYVNRDFSDEEQFESDLGLASDDLSAVALTMEKRFGMKIERHRYQGISNVNDYVEMIAEVLAGEIGR